MGVKEIEVKFRIYNSFDHDVKNIFMKPKKEVQKLNSNSYVYVFRTTLHNDVYLYSFNKITEANKDQKFGIPYKEFNHKVKCFFIVADFKLNENYIESLRNRIRNEYAGKKVLLNATNKNRRYTYADLTNTFAEWNHSNDPWVKDHVVYDNDQEKCNIVYLNDFKFTLTRFRNVFDQDLGDFNNLMGGGDTKTYGNDYLVKEELGRMTKDICDKANRWGMLYEHGQDLKDFLDRLDKAQKDRYNKLDNSALAIVTWLKSPGFFSYIQDYEYKYHQKDIDDFLLTIIDDIYTTTSGSTYTVQELLAIINDYMRVKKQTILKDVGGITEDELLSEIENHRNYSSMFSLVLKNVKSADSNFLKICKAVSKLFYTTSVGIDTKQNFTSIFVKTRIGITIQYRSYDIVNVQKVQNCFMVDRLGNAKFTRVALIDLKKPNWFDNMSKYKNEFNKVEAGLIMLNFAICMSKLNDILNDKTMSTEKRFMEIAALTKATADMIRVVVLRNLENKVTGYLAYNILKNAGIALNWLGAIIDFARYSYKTYEDICQMDYDAAIGSGFITVGSLGLSLVSLGVFTAESGVGLIILVVGIILLAGGSVLKIFCDDDDLDELLKQGQWGKYKLTKKKSYGDYPAQIERFYKFLVSYGCFIKNHVIGKVSIFSNKKIRVLVASVEPTYLLPTTKIKVTVMLIEGNAASQIVFNNYLIEGQNCDPIRENNEKGGTRLACIDLYLSDDKLKPAVEDFSHIGETMDYFFYDGNIQKRMNRIIYIKDLNKLIIDNKYKKASVKVQVDIYGDDKYVIEQKYQEASLEKDEVFGPQNRGMDQKKLIYIQSMTPVMME